MALISAKSVSAVIGLARTPSISWQQCLSLRRTQPASSTAQKSCIYPALSSRRSRRGALCGRVSMAKNIFDEMLGV